MGKHSATASLNLLLISLYPIVFIIGLVSLSPNIVFAQHEIDPETWIEMRKMIRHKGRTPSIEEEVAALAGPDAKSAGPRLIDHGPEALPAVHSALISDDVTLRHAQVLLQVIRSIGDKSSVPVVLEFLKRDTNNPLRRDALLVLALLPATEEAAAFIIELANNTNEKWHTYRMAFTWFGFHRDQRGRPYSQALLADPDPEKRAAGLFVLACLGDKSVLKPISQLLTAPPTNSRDALLYALAELTTPEEFQRLAPSSLAWSNGYKESLLYTQYVAAGPKEKIPLCLKMLRSQRAEHRRLAIRYLLDNGHANDLRPYAAVDLEAPGRAALIRNEIRKAGWHIIDTDEEFNIKQTAF
jgi:HEAT repeat protein